MSNELQKKKNEGKAAENYLLSIEDVQGLNRIDIEKLVFYITAGADFFTRKTFAFCKNLKIPYEKSSLNESDHQLEIIIQESNGSHKQKIGLVLINMKELAKDNQAKWCKIKKSKFQLEANQLDCSFSNQSSEIDWNLDDKSCTKTINKGSKHQTVSNSEKNQKLTPALKLKFEINAQVEEAENYDPKLKMKSASKASMKSLQGSRNKSQILKPKPFYQTHVDLTSSTLADNVNILNLEDSFEEDGTPAPRRISIQSIQSSQSNERHRLQSKALKQSFDEENSSSLMSAYKRIKDRRHVLSNADKLKPQPKVALSKTTLNLASNEKKANSKILDMHRSSQNSSRILRSASKNNMMIKSQTHNKSASNIRMSIKSDKSKSPSIARPSTSQFGRDSVRSRNRESMISKNIESFLTKEQKTTQVKHYQENVQKVKELKQVLEKETIPFFQKLVQQKGKMAEKKLNSLMKIDDCYQKIKERFAKAESEGMEIAEILVGVHDENVEQISGMVKLSSRMKQNLEFLETELYQMNVQLENTINQNAQLKLIEKSEDDLNEDSRSALEAVNNKCSKLETEMCWTDVQILQKKGRMQVVKEDYLFKIEQLLSLFQTLQSENIRTCFNINMEQNSLNTYSRKGKVIIEKHSTLLSKKTIQGEKISFLENELIRLRQQKRKLLADKRNKIGQQKTLKHNIGSQLRYFQRDCMLKLKNNIDITTQLQDGTLQDEELINIALEQRQKEVQALKTDQAKQQELNALTLTEKDDILFKEAEIFSQRKTQQERLVKIKQGLSGIFEEEIPQLSTEGIETIIEKLKEELEHSSKDMSTIESQELYQESIVHLMNLKEDLKSKVYESESFFNLISKIQREQESMMKKEALEILDQEEQIYVLGKGIETLKAEELVPLTEELNSQNTLANCFRKERNRWCQKIVEARIKEEELQARLYGQEAKQQDKIETLIEKEKRAKDLKEQLENRLIEKVLYRGNGDKTDRLDQALVHFLKENKVYIEVVYVERGKYSLGGSKPIKVKQAGERIVVQKGQNFLSVLKYLKEYLPKVYEKTTIFKTHRRQLSTNENSRLNGNKSGQRSGQRPTNKQSLYQSKTSGVNSTAQLNTAEKTVLSRSKDLKVNSNIDAKVEKSLVSNSQYLKVNQQLTNSISVNKDEKSLLPEKKRIKTQRTFTEMEIDEGVARGGKLI